MFVIRGCTCSECPAPARRGCVHCLFQYCGFGLWFVERALRSGKLVVGRDCRLLLLGCRLMGFLLPYARLCQQEEETTVAPPDHAEEEERPPPPPHPGYPPPTFVLRDRCSRRPREKSGTKKIGIIRKSLPTSVRRNRLRNCVSNPGETPSRGQYPIPSDESTPGKNGHR